jgi:mono/diheme cytochrome c family protein
VIAARIVLLAVFAVAVPHAPRAAGPNETAGGRIVRAVPQAGRTTNDAVFTAEQARRGEVLYQFVCAGCHGATLAGIEAAPPLAGATFSASWSGAPVGDLFERIRISMPQDKPGSLGRQQAADLVAYMLGVNKAPAGQTELPADGDVLKAITIAAAQ